jgi:hypothetical protein
MSVVGGDGMPNTFTAESRYPTVGTTPSPSPKPVTAKLNVPEVQIVRRVHVPPGDRKAK